MVPISNNKVSTITHQMVPLSAACGKVVWNIAHNMVARGKVVWHLTHDLVACRKVVWNITHLLVACGKVVCNIAHNLVSCGKVVWNLTHHVTARGIAIRKAERVRKTKTSPIEYDYSVCCVPKSAHTRVADPEAGLCARHEWLGVESQGVVAAGREAARRIPRLLQRGEGRRYALGRGRRRCVHVILQAARGTGGRGAAADGGAGTNAGGGGGDRYNTLYRTYDALLTYCYNVLTNVILVIIF